MYVGYARARTDAPLAFHLGVGLAMLQAALPSDLDLTMQSRKRKLSMWTLVVGASGRSRKSAAVEIGADLMEEAELETLGPDPESPEGLVDSLKQKPTQLVVYSEYAEFLGRTAQEGYMKPMRDMMLKASDGRTITRRLANKKLIEVHKPNLSVLAGVNQTLLDQYVTRMDFTNGWMSRWLIFNADRQREYPPDLPDDPASRARIIEILKERASLDSFSTGPFTGFDERAQAAWREWATMIERRGAGSPLESMYARAPTTSMKVSMLIAWGIPGAGADNAEWSATPECIEASQAITEFHLRSAESILHRLANSVEERQLERVYACTSRVRNSPTPYSKLLTQSRLIQRQFDLVVSTLTASKLITEAGTRIKGEKCFLRTDAVEAPTLVEVGEGAAGEEDEGPTGEELEEEVREASKVIQLRCAASNSGANSAELGDDDSGGDDFDNDLEVPDDLAVGQGPDQAGVVNLDDD